MSDYNFVQIDDNSYPAIQELYFKSFGLKETVVSIKEKYDTGMFGMKNTGFMAIDKTNDYAAYYGVFPMQMRIDNKDFQVAQSGDTMTAPNHRGKGLFIDLAKQTYLLAQKKGIQLIFGFPNKNSFPGFQKKLDWKFYGCMQNFIIPNNVIPFCELSSKFKFFMPWYNKYCNLKLSKYKIELTEENTNIFQDNNSRGFVKKDINFFKYKLRNKSNYLVKINNFTLLIKPIPHLLVGAVGKFMPEKTNEFLSTLKTLSIKLGCKKTIISISENHWLFSYLKNKLEYTESLPIGYFPINHDLPFADISYIGADYDTF